MSELLHRAEWAELGYGLSESGVHWRVMCNSAWYGLSRYIILFDSHLKPHITCHESNIDFRLFGGETMGDLDQITSEQCGRRKNWFNCCHWFSSKLVSML